MVSGLRRSSGPAGGKPPSPEEVRAGHFGLLQQQLYEVYETLDGGESWAKVSLARGLGRTDPGALARRYFM
jgi:hypothetical protein